MGCSINTSKRVLQMPPNHSLFAYPRTVLLTLNAANKSKEQKELHLTEPTFSIATILKVTEFQVYLSLCVLPGIDPHTNNAKVCQDACLYINDDNSLLMALFDGHGKQGELIVDFCCKYINDLYFVLKDKHVVTFTQGNPLNFLQEISSKCEEKLKTTLIDISSSGCTALFVYFIKGNLYMASVGDSRSILGTEVLPQILPVKEIDSNHTDVLNDIKELRKLPCSIYSMQLTKDQKPEHPEELARILENGGRVQQLLDDNGVKIGPYRVFDMNGNYPGLAMSRSFGDMLGKQVGIISTPIFTKHKLHKDVDSFVVMASDGVWDVMDNQEVVNFVETFRTRCIKKMDSSTENVENITPENSSIAQLLCEEARTRWYTIVESESVMIDDISCIVLEFNQKVLAQNGLPRYIQQFTQKNVHIGDVRRATTVHEISTRDPRRGSFCDPKIL